MREINKIKVKKRKKTNRPLDIVDVKALADMKMTNIIKKNKDTGETTVVRPTGWRAIPAFFKQPAKISFMTKAGESVGHYYNGHREEIYKPVYGRNDCLLIGYHESLGRKVTENFIHDERTKLEHMLQSVMMIIAVLGCFFLYLAGEPAKYSPGGCIREIWAI